MTIICLNQSFSDWLAERLACLQVRQDTNAYIVGVLNGMKRGEVDISNQSLVLTYYDAICQQNFERFQQIGDYVLWCEIFIPQSFKEHELAITLARKSYRECWRILRGEWYLYDELADRLPDISHQIRAVFAPHAKNCF